MAKQEEPKRGIYLFINEDGTIGHAVLGSLSEVEARGLTNYLQGMMIESSIEKNLAGIQGIISITDMIASSMERIANAIEGETQCGTDLSEACSPSQDLPCSTPNAQSQSKDSSPEKQSP